MLRPVQEALEGDYCMYGDNYFIDPKTIGPFIELPDGRLPMDPWEIRTFRKDGPGADFYTCGYYGLMRDCFDYFAERCITEIRRGDIDTFARFLGSIAHVIEDSGTPAHAVGTNLGTDFKLIKLLHPCGDHEKMAAQFHPILECRYEPFVLDYRPRLLGRTPEEISFRFLERYTDMIEGAIGFVLPVMNAFYAGDDALVARRLTQCGRFCSEVLADFIHSLFAVGAGRITPEELENLRMVSLGGLTPLERSAWMPNPYPYVEIRNAPWSRSQGGKQVPLMLEIDGEETEYADGFGLGPPFEATYQLPEGVFERFESAVGLNSRLPSVAGVVFEVWGDGVLIASRSCQNVHESGLMRCELHGVREIKLRISATGDKPWPGHTHAVWGAARLFRPL